MNQYDRYTIPELHRIAKAMHGAIPGSPAYMAAQGAQREIEHRAHIEALSKADTQENAAVKITDTFPAARED